MREHFLDFWSQSANRKKLAKKAMAAFEKQNQSMLEKAKEEDMKDLEKAKKEGRVPTKAKKYENDAIKLKKNLNDDMKNTKLDKKLLEVEEEGFTMGFHPHPKHSVGHLHMHVFPSSEVFRKQSAVRHDGKTVPFDVVVETEEEIAGKGEGNC